MKTTIDANGVSSTKGATELDVRGKFTVYGVNIPEQLKLMSISVSELSTACFELKEQIAILKAAVNSQQEMIETLEKKIGTFTSKSASKSAAKDS